MEHGTRMGGAMGGEARGGKSARCRRTARTPLKWVEWALYARDAANPVALWALRRRGREVDTGPPHMQRGAVQGRGAKEGWVGPQVHARTCSRKAARAGSGSRGPQRWRQAQPRRCAGRANAHRRARRQTTA